MGFAFWTFWTLQAFGSSWFGPWTILLTLKRCNAASKKGNPRDELSVPVTRPSEVRFLTLTGWWLSHPSEKYESQWEGLSHILWKIKKNPNHQPAKAWMANVACKPTRVWLPQRPATVIVAFAKACWVTRNVEWLFLPEQPESLQIIYHQPSAVWCISVFSVISKHFLIAGWATHSKIVKSADRNHLKSQVSMIENTLLIFIQYIYIPSGELT